MVSQDTDYSDRDMWFRRRKNQRMTQVKIFIYF